MSAAYLKAFETSEKRGVDAQCAKKAMLLNAMVPHACLSRGRMAKLQMKWRLVTALTAEAAETDSHGQMEALVRLSSDFTTVSCRVQ